MLGVWTRPPELPQHYFIQQDKLKQDRQGYHVIDSAGRIQNFGLHMMPNYPQQKPDGE